jgi:hypothetical protein
MVFSSKIYLDVDDLVQIGINLYGSILTGTAIDNIKSI